MDETAGTEVNRAEGTGGRAPHPWRLTREGDYLFADWDGQSVLYHTGSGDTRWISALSRMILETLRAGPADHAALFASLRDVVAEADRSWLDDALGEALQELYELDLLESA
ncbi:MAG: HPr-rel-A system PqqD family peptide chaperone [Betaproteobacteria bacterium]|nr:HPr-rel-A system PqqD family peptide chaperone [Betaproteobacteria bacterium]